jgi:hypothetical protein
MNPIMIADVLELAISLLGTVAEHIAAGKSKEPIEISMIGTQHAQAAAMLRAYLEAQK